MIATQEKYVAFPLYGTISSLHPYQFVLFTGNVIHLEFLSMKKHCYFLSRYGTAGTSSIMLYLSISLTIVLVLICLKIGSGIYVLNQVVQLMVNSPYLLVEKATS